MPVAELARGVAQLGLALIVLSVGVGALYHTIRSAIAKPEPRPVQKSGVTVLLGSGRVVHTDRLPAATATLSERALEGAIAIHHGNDKRYVRRHGAWWALAADAPRPVCGVIDGGSQRPCVLERDHRDHEHATCWLDADDARKQYRHRWDANDVLGRDELRWKSEYLPKFTPDGERA